MQFLKATSQAFSLGNKKYYYWTEGDSKNPWLIFLAGFSGTHTDFLELARDLKEDYFIIIPDLPGWGASDSLKEKITIQHYADYIKKLINHLNGGNISFVAHCSGNAIALAYLSHYPQHASKQHFLISVPYQEGMMSKEVFLHLSDMSRKAPKLFKRIFFLWRSRIFILPYSLFSIKIRGVKKKMRFMLHGLLTQQQQDEQVVESNWNSFIHFDFSKAKNISTSFHLIHGAEDIVIPLQQAEKFQQILLDATLDVLPRAGHIPPVEAPMSVGNTIRKYLQ